MTTKETGAIGRPGMSEPQPSAFERRNSEDFKTLRGYLLCGFGAPLDSRVRVEGLGFGIQRIWKFCWQGGR